MLTEAPLLSVSGETAELSDHPVVLLMAQYKGSGFAWLVQRPVLLINDLLFIGEAQDNAVFGTDYFFGFTFTRSKRNRFTLFAHKGAPMSGAGT